MTDCAAVPDGPDGPPLLRLRDLTDLVEAVPYLLGFYPARSLAVVLLHGTQQRLGITLRYDLPKAEAAGVLARQVAAHASMHGADRAVLLVFADRGEATDGLPERSLVEQTCAALKDADIAAVDALCVCGDRCWSYACLDPQCCPSDGRALPAADAAPSAVAATAVRVGLVALPDRSAVARTLEPVDGSARARVEQALAAAEAAFVKAAAADGVAAWRAAMCRTVERVIERTLAREVGSEQPPCTDEQSAELLVALSDLAVRDDCWRRMERGGQEDGLALWSHLVHRAVPPYDAAPLFLLAWTAWRRGDGVLARMAAERALVSDANYRAASLLLDALDSCIDPRWVPALTSGRGRPRRRRTEGRRR